MDLREDEICEQLTASKLSHEEGVRRLNEHYSKALLSLSLSVHTFLFQRSQCLQETAYLRLRRVKMKLKDFQPLALIGKGTPLPFSVPVPVPLPLPELVLVLLPACLPASRLIGPQARTAKCTSAISATRAKSSL
jgi:hypothetical protein